MARVFLSYARDDEPRARSLAKALGDAGHDVWWDRNLHGGSRFASEIDLALKQAQVVVVLWSDSSVGSAWVQDEAAEGLEKGCLVPVALDRTKPPLGFRQYQTLDLAMVDGKVDGAQLGALERAIQQAVGAGGELNPPESPPEPVEPARAKPSICVLPFLNMSGDSEQEYFSDGISEDVITDLSKISALSIVNRNTAFSLKGKDIDIKEVGSRLNVSHVLEGSVRRAGGRVRINAQLIDAAAGDHVWAERFDSDLSDIFAIQDEISKAIVSALQLKLLPQEKKAIERRGTEDPNAYNLYLKARQHWISGNDGNSRRDDIVMRICRQATSIDPTYARAWALMALAQSELRFMHGRDEDARNSAETALELDPSIAEAYCVKARYFADEEGKPDKADRQIEIALRLDPDSWEANKEAARLLFRRGEMEAAIPFFEKAARLMDTDYHSSGLLQTCYLSLGDRDGAQRAARMTVSRAEKARAHDPTNGAALGMGACSLAVLGEVERTKEWAESAMLMDPQNHTMRYNVVCAMALADSGSALDYLEELAGDLNIHLARHLLIDPDVDSLRGEPRFQQVVADIKARVTEVDMRGEDTGLKVVG